MPTQLPMSADALRNIFLDWIFAESVELDAAADDCGSGSHAEQDELLDLLGAVLATMSTYSSESLRDATDRFEQRQLLRRRPMWLTTRIKATVSVILSGGSIQDRLKLLTRIVDHRAISESSAIVSER